MKIIEKIAAKCQDNLNAPTPLIAFFGDSVTQGALKGYYDYDMVYHNQLKKILGVLYPDVNVNILNTGIGGTTAGFGIERLDRDVISHKPDMCVVCFGLNDCNEEDGCIKSYQDNLTAIFKKLKANDIEVIFMTPNMMNTRITDDIEEKYSDYAKVTMERMNSGLFDRFLEAGKEAAKASNVPVCDCYAKWKKLAECGVDTTKLLINGINHPVPAMHKLFAQSLLETMINN